MASKQDWLSNFRKMGAQARIDLVGVPLVMELRPGWEVRRTGLNKDLLYFCLEGGFDLVGSSKIPVVKAEEVLVVPAGLPFHFRLGSRSRSRIVRFRLARPPGLARQKFSFGHYGFGHTTGAWLSVLSAEVNGSPGQERTGVGVALQGLLQSLERQGDRGGLRRGPWRNLSAAETERLRTWTEQLPPLSRPTVADLAKVLGMSPDYSARLFRQAYGQSFEKWIITQRMRSAALRLVESSLSINAVAEEYGFSTPFFFSRQFKEVLGCSPRRFRAERSAAFV